MTEFVNVAGPSSDVRLVAACAAARKAMQSFDKEGRSSNAARNYLSADEQGAVLAVCETEAATPTGVAAKAQLLDYMLSLGRLSHSTKETVALSLANDAMALAQGLLATRN